MRTQRLLIVAVSVGVVLAGIWGIVSYRYNQTHPAILRIDVTPTSSHVTIDGKKASIGLNRTKPGKHSVRVFREGFNDETKDVETNATTETYIGIALRPNSSETTDWYANHPEDQSKYELISSTNFDISTREKLDGLPLLQELPFIDQFFRVDYGASEKYPEDAHAIAIYITYYSEEGKEAALDWIKFKGANPADLEIIYVSKI